MAGAAEAPRIVCPRVDSIANTRPSRGETSVIDALDAGAGRRYSNRFRPGARLYLFPAGAIPLTDTRGKREAELREALGDVRLVACNYVAVLWTRR